MTSSRPAVAAAAPQLAALRVLARAALTNLEANRARIDDLNVYPVPDGDTGTNLVLTLRKIVEALESSSASRQAELAAEVSRVALRAGKGNSGVIFSQIVRGFAASLADAEEIDAARLAAALRRGSDAAYAAVGRVGAVEGTILTVIREMAEEAEEASKSSPVSAPELLRAVLARGEDALARTPELLDILGEAGVVDAGGAGLVEIVRGATLAANGQPLPAREIEREHLAPEAVHRELSRYRYCTGFVVEGEALDASGLEETLGLIGDSLLVVGDASALKVHVHTDDPGAALSAATVMGAIDEVEIADMYAQTAAREARLSGTALVPPPVPRPRPALTTGIVAVSQGAGNRAIFENEHVTVVEGGQTRNPSVGELLDAIAATPTEAVIVLPNNSNVILTAQEAAKESEKNVRVVPSRSLQAGIAALESYVADHPAESNEAAMLTKLDAIVTGEVTIASREALLDGVQISNGAYLGLVEGTAMSSGGDLGVVVSAVVERLLDGEREFLRILVGAGAPRLDELLADIERAHPEVEVEVVDGGQPHYPLLLLAE